MELKKLLGKYLDLLSRTAEVEKKLSEKGVDPTKIRIAYQMEERGGGYAATTAGSTSFRYSHGVVKEKILEWLKDKSDGFEFRNRDVKYALDISASSTAVALGGLAEHGILERVSRGRYKVVSGVQRRIE